MPRCASSQQTSVTVAADGNDTTAEIADLSRTAVADTAPLLSENQTESNDDCTDDEYLDVPSTQIRVIPSFFLFLFNDIIIHKEYMYKGVVVQT